MKIRKAYTPEVTHAGDIVVPLVLGEAKVGDLEGGHWVRAVVTAQDEGPIQQQVVRLEVKVHDLHLVEVRQPVDRVQRQLSAHAQRDDALAAVPATPY